MISSTYCEAEVGVMETAAVIGIEDVPQNIFAGARPVVVFWHHFSETLSTGAAVPGVLPSNKKFFAVSFLERINHTATGSNRSRSGSLRVDESAPLAIQDVVVRRGGPVSSTPGLFVLYAESVATCIVDKDGCPFDQVSTRVFSND